MKLFFSACSQAPSSPPTKLPFWAEQGQHRNLSSATRHERHIIPASSMSHFAKVDTELRLRPPSNYVKVIKRGAPYLRKVDLTEYRGYGELRAALGELFRLAAGGFSVAYWDEAGDFKLASDHLPWGEFVSRCKRLRVLSPGEPIYG